MKSIDVANYIIDRWGRQVELTNLKLNKLVYFAQAKSLRSTGELLFDDQIQAWKYGPVEPAVYHAFSGYGKRRIERPTGKAAPSLSRRSAEIIDEVVEHYGSMSAFDLVGISHKRGGAWASRFSPDADNVIEAADILSSSDLEDAGEIPLASAISSAAGAMPNALKLLENS